MSKSAKQKGAPETDVLVSTATGPLVFISHDHRDADLAEAFSKLLKSVSAGMIKTFRSSDKKGTDGIAFGAEWYQGLMAKLQSTSDLVCLFTERSLERPWLLFEAGIAKAKLTTPVIGFALGIPLKRVSAGPFYNFQNMDDSETDLTKLVQQLAGRVPSLELDADVVKSQVATFTAAKDQILQSLATGAAKKESGEDADDSAVTKLVEEMKALPLRVAERLAESGEPFRRRRMRRFHPMMMEELLHMGGERSDPVGILIAASLVRDEMPWLYELATEVYRAVKLGDQDAIEREMARLRQFSEFMMRGPFMEEFGGRDFRMFAMEFPRMLEHMLRRSLEEKKPHARRRHPKTEADQQ